MLENGRGYSYLQNLLGENARFRPEESRGMRLKVTKWTSDDPNRPNANALMKEALDLDFQIQNIDSLTLEHKENSNVHRDLVSKGRVQANYRYDAIWFVQGHTEQDHRIPYKTATLIPSYPQLKNIT